jgi:hypothetical protein
MPCTCPTQNYQAKETGSQTKVQEEKKDNNRKKKKEEKRNIPRLLTCGSRREI